MTLVEKLRQYNAWRRGESDWTSEWSPTAKELGELIDAAIEGLMHRDELLVAAIKVDALSIQSDAHKSLRAAIASVKGQS